MIKESDEELMLRYASADDAVAFEELYRRYSARVFSYLVKNCWDSKDAEEIHQGVFLKMHQRKETYDPKFPFSAWLFTMVKTTMIDDFRKTKTRSNILKKSENIEVEDGEDNAVPDLSLTDQLDESQKKLLELRYLEEWSFEEMAKEFKVNAATIRKRISRLLKQLRGAT